MIRLMEWPDSVQQRELHILEIDPRVRKLKDLIMEETKGIVADGHVFIGGVFKASEVANNQRPIEAQMIIHGHASPEELACFVGIIYKQVAEAIEGSDGEDGA